MITSKRDTRGGAVAAVLVGALLLAACGSSSPHTTAHVAKPSKAPTVVNVIYQPSGLSSYFYANAKDLWAKYGLKINPISIEAGQNELAPLVAGSAEFAFMGGPPTITAVGKSVPVRIIFSTNDVSRLEGLVVPKGSPITSLRDIVGKTIAVPTGSSAWAGMHLALAKAGIPFSAVHTENLAPSAALAAFEAGSIQGAWIWDTWLERMVGLGGHIVALEHNYGVQEPNSWVVSSSFVASHPKVVEAFIAALNAGAVGVNADPSAAAASYSTLTGVTPAEAVTIMKTEPTFTLADALSPSDPLSFVSENTGFAEALYRSGEVLAAAGIIPSAPSLVALQGAIDVSIVKATAKAYG
ncbi:MAG: ABC transporter substrate-binding protein [Actinomycetota bacterium]|jgi:ABC-type nitrate/sulfonate/bicarbonate transport system substrate-binding protein|nr:ABC transporter substrate-binding protein [Actinomycetota bacterium]